MQWEEPETPPPKLTSRSERRSLRSESLRRHGESLSRAHGCCSRTGCGAIRQSYRIPLSPYHFAEAALGAARAESRFSGQAGGEFGGRQASYIREAVFDIDKGALAALDCAELTDR
jgi:hypothetical protein